MVVQPTNLTGARKAAILSLILGEEQASKVFRHLREDEVEKITREVAALGAVSTEIGEKVLEEFHSLSTAAGLSARGGVEVARSMLQKSLDPLSAPRVIDRLLKSFQSTAGFNALEKADPQQLSKFILGEHPQTIALILAHLNADQRGAAHRRCCPTSCAPTCSRAWPASTKSRPTSFAASRR